MVLLLIVLVNLTPVQNFLVRKATHILQDKLKTKVSIDHVRINFLNKVLVQGVYVEDRAGDTLLYAGELQTRITDWFIFKKEIPVVSYVGLKDAYVHLYRTNQSKEWNYQFIIDAFDTGPKKKKQPKNDFEIDIDKVALSNVKFHMDDAWGGSDYDIDMGNFLLDADKLDLKNRKVAINVLEIEQVLVSIREYEVAKGYQRKPKVHHIDTTAFNPDLWAVSAKRLSLKDSRFLLNTSKSAAHPAEFDPEHIDVSSINIAVENLAILADTLTASVKNMTAFERCGLQVKALRADVTVSPNASICDHLYLETNRSKLQRYYAMHYNRFPDFLDYIDKVRMTGDLKNATIDYRDVAFFAPALKNLPVIVQASGVIQGTVDSLTGKDLAVTDGNTKLSGNLSMTGLPDINNTFINFTNGLVYVNKTSAFKYFPELKNFRTIDFDALGHIDYKGDFVGYIDRFAANGVLHTDLGSVTSNVKLSLPNMDPAQASYSGTITSSSLQVGKLFRYPDFGAVALSVNVEGKAFDPQNAKVNLNGVINSLEYLGYKYSDIQAEGTLAQKKFNGQLLINDPNLALAFYGAADFSQPQLQINAKANLLSSNLKALHLLQDSVTAATDFDLDFKGNNIDEFIGFAKLYNVNINRNGHRLDVDSLYLNSSYTDGKKLLTLESNILGAKVEGNYSLSNLPYSFQYYISGYLPNYLAAPTRYAPDQVINFNVQTRETDSLLSVIMPGLYGFNNASLSGSLNTNTQNLNLQAYIPYGYVMGAYFDTATVQAMGNFNQLYLQANANKLALGDGLVTAAFNGNAFLGNDSLRFKISTDSKDDYGTAKIEGHAFASGDSLYLSLAPSEFFLNKYRWEILSGNRLVFAKDYLMVRDLLMQSGKQLITVNSFNETTQQAIDVAIKDFDLTMLGNLADIALYEPAGRLNGDVVLKDIYRGLKIQSKTTAEDVKFGRDTIGTVKVFGEFDTKKETITLDQLTGIYRGQASLTASGIFALDSTNNQVLNGTIKLQDADINWVHPFVSDFLSKMSGTLNGSINIRGTAFSPDVDGVITLNNAGTKIDVIGTYYRIPAAIIQVNNKNIDFGKVSVFDEYGNDATLTGGLRHDRLRNIQFDRIQVTSPKFEVLNLTEKDNSPFYGNLIANVAALTIAGSIEDIRMNIRATPAAASHIYIPIQSSTDISTYNYISFKQYGKEEVIKPKKKNKFSLTISGDMNPLAELTMVIDPVSGDLIHAKGNGNITLSLPANEDMKMYGSYEIETGKYTFNFKKLFFVRNFKINQGSRIVFNGPLSNTNLDINAIYTARLRPSDVLNELEKNAIKGTTEWTESSTRQDVNVFLNMTGQLEQPVLNFKLDLDKRFEGTLVGNKVAQINQDYSTLFDQVASLLLIGTFIPSGGLLSGGSSTTTSASAAVNSNFGDVVSSTVSSQLTNIMSKILNDPSFAIDLKYNNYSYSAENSATQGLSRNEVSVGIKKNFFKNRVLLEVGSAYDWGRPTASNNNSNGNLNLAGNFRAQYLITEDGRLLLNMFRTNSYDILMNDNVYRGGIGISYRTSFDNLREFFGIREKVKLPETKDTIKSENTSDTRGTSL